MKSFHGFRLDTVNHCLWRGDERLPLTPKAFDVLRYLVEHSDRLVTQDEILEALWPETYVNAEVVKKHVLGIRKVLGDQPDKPVFVATFPRRGYQFIAPVRDESTSSPGIREHTTKTVVGREDALAQLDACLDKALQGQRQVVFVTGEAGIGKTTLADVFHQRASFRPNLRIARGQCVEGFGGKEAYYPVLEALGQLVREAEGSPLIQALIRSAPTWAIQFPSVLKGDQRGALQKEILGATLERMVREICESLEVVTAQLPLVFILEDLHWVDASTLDLISALARRRGSAKLMLLCTYRPADVIIAQRPLKALKQDLLVHNLCQEIALERLEELDVAEYLSSKFPESQFPMGLAKTVYRHSGGNPLFMAAIVAAMAEKGLIDRVGEVWALTTPLEGISPDVPETLQQLIQVQFEQLSTSEQSILRTGSVAGERFSVWAITAALEMEPGKVEDVCERLAEKQQFVRPAGIHELPNGEFSAYYEFRHSLYREVLYRRLSDVSSSKLHRLLAGRLKCLCTGERQEVAPELALHFERGYAYEDAVRYLLLTAGNDTKRFAYRDAIQTLEHAFELVPKIPSHSRTETEIRVLERLGDAHYALGQMEESARAYQREEDRAILAGLKAHQISALICLARPAAFVDPDGGMTVCDRALQVSSTHDDPVFLARARMLAGSSRLLYDQWRKEDAEMCAAAYRVLRELGRDGCSTFERILYACVLTFQGHYRDVLTWIGPDYADKVENTSFAVYPVLAARGMALMNLGQLGEAVQIAQTGRQLAEKNGNDPWCSIFRCLEVLPRTMAFDFEGARALCEIILRAEKDRPARRARTIAGLFIGYADLTRGKSMEAVQRFSQILEQPLHPRYFLQWYWRMNTQLGMANAWLAAGNLADSRTETERFLESALSTADPNLQALGWDLDTRVAVAERNWERADNSLQKGLAILEGFEIPATAWRVQATAYDFYSQIKKESAEMHRARAEAYIRVLADSLASDEPLRSTFLAAAPVRRILNREVKTRAAERSSTSTSR